MPQAKARIPLRGSAAGRVQLSWHEHCFARASIQSQRQIVKKSTRQALMAREAISLGSYGHAERVIFSRLAISRGFRVADFACWMACKQESEARQRPPQGSRGFLTKKRPFLQPPAISRSELRCGRPIARWNRMVRILTDFFE